MACSSAAFCSPDCAAAAAADPGSHCAAVCAWLRACNMEGLSDEQQSAMQFLFRCASLAAAAAAGAPAAAQHGAQLEALAPGPSGAPVALTLERQELHGRLAHALAAVGAAPLASGLSAQQVAELLVRDETNAYGIMAAPGPGGERRLRGAGLYATPSLVNHDCMPNVARFDAFDAPGDAPRSNTAVQLRALHDIPAGEEITQSYFPLEWGFHERQDRCQQQYGFACACLRCKEEATWQSDGGDEDAGMADGGACAHGGAPGACQRCCAGGASAQPATAAGDAGAADPAYIGMFISKFVCPAEDCGGTMAPAAPGADVAECNVSRRKMRQRRKTLAAAAAMRPCEPPLALKHHAMPALAAEEAVGTAPLKPVNSLTPNGYDTSALDGVDYARSAYELIGRTPLVLVQDGGETKGTILGKLEAFQPLASVKDRMARSMIEDAEERGTTLVEATSGNTGVALAFLGAAKGYDVIITMPAFCSLERRVLQKAFGAKLVLTDPTRGCIGAFEKALEILEREPNTHMLNQFDNEANPRVHYRTTGPEVWKATKGKVDVFISIIAVEPVESAVITAQLNGTEAVRKPHWIQARVDGMGAGFVPPVLDTEVLDEVITVTSEEAVAASRKLAKEKGIFVGISSGATATAAHRVANRPENAGKVIVAMFSSFGERYLSSPLFEEVTKEAREQEFEPWAPSLARGSPSASPARRGPRTLRVAAVAAPPRVEERAPARPDLPPAIDGASFLAPGRAGALPPQAVADAIREAASEYGCFQLVNHGVDSELMADLQAQMRAFFALPLDAKLAVGAGRSGHWWRVQWGFDFCHEVLEATAASPVVTAPNQWPADQPEFRRVMEAWLGEMSRVSFKLLEAFSLGLHLPPHTLHPVFQARCVFVCGGSVKWVGRDDHTSFMRLNHYPETQPRFFTILIQDPRVHGLQFFRAGGWVDIPPIPGALTINVGDQCQARGCRPARARNASGGFVGEAVGAAPHAGAAVISNDVFPACLHRVLSPHVPGGRYSAPFFFNPRPEAVIAPLPAFVAPERPPAYRPIPWSAFREQRYAGDYADVGEEIQISHYRL
eukprot:scaffold16.g58.t1